MERNVIQVMIRRVYGVDKVYPVCDTAKIFADIAGSITLLEQDLVRIQQLGYKVHVISEEPPKWLQRN